MSRYIEVNAFYDKMYEWVRMHGGIIRNEMQAILEAVSYIDIVRCKECKYYKQSEAFCENGNGLWQAGDECFCNYGEREGE